MDHFQRIYASHADSYHRIITPADVDGSLLPALERVTPFGGKRILDLGTGTGRIPLLVDSVAAQIVGLDLHKDMLRENQRQRISAHGGWQLLQGDMRALPFLSGWADVVTAGWAIGHFQSWYAGNWQTEIGRVLLEMQRVVKPGGAIIIIETLTTGSTAPAPPSEGLARYYAWLEGTWGFTREEISIDYQFDSIEEAVVQLGFFFGPTMAERIRKNDWARVPEWAGVWGKVVK